MPRVPQFQGLPAPAPAAQLPLQTRTQRVAEETAGALTNIALDAREEAIKQVQRRRNSEGRRKVTQFLNGLAEEFSTRQDDGFALEHETRARAGVNDIMRGFEDDELLHTAVGDFAGRAVDGQQQSMNLREAGLQHQKLLQELDLSLEAHADAAGIAGTDAAWQRAIGAADNEIGLAEEEGDIDEATALKLRNGVREGAARSRAAAMIRDDPDEALIALQDPEHPFLKTMDPTVRDQMINSALAEKARRDREQAESLSELRAAQEREFLARIYDPDHADGPPTIHEIFASDLTGPRAEHLVKLIRDGAAGADLNRTDEALTNQLWERVHFSDHPRRITSTDELIPFLGNGLSRENFDKLDADLTKGGDPTQTAKNRLRTEFIRSGKSQISGTTMMSIDVEGDRQAFLFVAEVEELLRKGAEKGLDEFDLLSPSSPHFINKNNELVDRHFRTLTQQKNDLRRQFERLRGGSGIGRAAAAAQESAREPEAVPEPVPLERLPGETAEDFLKRQGL